METKAVTVTFQQFIDALERADVVSLNGDASKFYIDEHYCEPEPDEPWHSIKLEYPNGVWGYIQFKEEDNHAIPYEMGTYSLATFYEKDWSGEIEYDTDEVNLYIAMPNPNN